MIFEFVTEVAGPAVRLIAYIALAFGVVIVAGMLTSWALRLSENGEDADP